MNISLGLTRLAHTVPLERKNQSVYLNDTESNHHGWEYEIRTDAGEVKKVTPRYIDEYSYTLSDENCCEEMPHYGRRTDRCDSGNGLRLF